MNSYISSSHRHDWQTRSRHRTSDGTVRYDRCRCGVWLVVTDQVERTPRVARMIFP
ncbi:hypothetical protein [Virgisporangium aliadipatigenens]|uniref:hypothetical protein n=1 Tax=Virgisporangium aliadipatigenens TaxID=741659 RepID=UPI001944C05A|nr:hypothetical protein [Virgisporangium aliadipatigenens]